MGWGDMQSLSEFQSASQEREGNQGTSYEHRHVRRGAHLWAPVGVVYVHLCQGPSMWNCSVSLNYCTGLLSWLSISEISKGRVSASVPSLHPQVMVQACFGGWPPLQWSVNNHHSV